MLWVSGDVDFAAVDVVRQAALGAVSPDDPGLVLELGGVTFLDSAGIHLLVQLAEGLWSHRQRLGVVVPANSAVRGALAVAGVGQIVGLVADLPSALDTLR